MGKLTAKIFVLSIFILSLLCKNIADAQVTAVQPDTLEKPSGINLSDTIRLCFAGDMMMHSRQMEYSYKSYFRKTEDIFRNADITIANMEFTLAGEPHSGYPQFSAPDDYADYMAKTGIDVFLCANNHILDKGSEGAERTLQQYRNLGTTYGIRFTGAASSQEELESTTPLILRHRNFSIALINFTYGTNLGSTAHWPRINYMRQKEFLKTALQKADSLSSFTIVLPHWGEEYQLLHSESQEETARWLIESGADLIVGTHPHVIQDMARIDGVTVAYSLGNTVSNMSAPNTQLGMILIVTLVMDGNGEVRLCSLEPVFTWCSRPGGYGNSYIVLPVEDHIGKRDEWQGAWDYDKMIDTYERVRHIHKNEQQKDN